MDHQNWNTVTIHGKTNTVQQNAKQNNKSELPKFERTQEQALNIRLEDNSAETPHVQEKIPHTFRTEFIKARTGLKLSQEALAKSVNLKGGSKMIKDLESGKLSYIDAKKIALQCRKIIGIVKI